MDRYGDPYRSLHLTSLVGGGLFALGYWAILVVALFTGGFTFGGLLVTVLVSGAAVLGFFGWRRQRIVLSGGALALLLAALALSRYV